MLRYEKIEELITANPFEVYPELKVWLDEDGLLVIRPEMIVRSRGIEYKQHLILYHDGLEPIILNGCLCSCMQEAMSVNTEVSVRINEDHLRPSSDRDAYFFQKEYWFGPEFSPTSLSTAYFGGLTVHYLRSDNTTKSGKPPHRVEFLISGKGHQKTLEFEDLVLYHLPQSGVETKYDHAIWDTKLNQFSHLDLATIWYSDQAYIGRIEYHLDERPRKQPKQKLLRMDGNICVSLFEKIIVHFHTNNPLIREYFAGNNAVGKEIKDTDVIVADHFWEQLNSRLLSTE